MAQKSFLLMIAEACSANEYRNLSLRQKKLMSFRFHPSVEHVAGSSIIVTGCGRSGTTIIGKIMATAKYCEYFFEPESLVGLFATSRLLTDECYRALYTSILVEHLCTNSLAGRSLNTNIHDDSSVIGIKESQEINRRLSRSWRRDDLLGALMKYKAAFKLPSITPFLHRHLDTFQDTSIIIVSRDPESVYRSTKSKGWFSGKGDRIGGPFMSMQTSASVDYIPYWVKVDDHDTWKRSTEIERFHYYYKLVYSSALELCDKVTIVDYGKLLSDPAQVINSMFTILGLAPSATTYQNISQVSERSPKDVIELNQEEHEAIADLKQLHQRLVALSI